MVLLVDAARMAAADAQGLEGLVEGNAVALGFGLGDRAVDVGAAQADRQRGVLVAGSAGGRTA